MERSESIIELAKALSKFQGAMQSVSKGSVNPYFHSKYADLDAVWEACRKALSENGLAVAQATVDGEGKLFLETLLLHTSGEFLSSRYPLTPMRQVSGGGWAESGDPQSIGSAITYARRYAMSAMLGISADDDDDAEAATRKEPAQLASAPRGFCPVHKVPFVERSAGIAKATGRAYPAFWACPTRGCKERPQAQKQEPVPPVSGEEPPPPDAQEGTQEAQDDKEEPQVAAGQAKRQLPPFPVRGEKEAAVNYYLKVAKERYGLVTQKEALAVIGGTWSGWVDKQTGDGEEALRQALAALAEM